MGAIRFVVNRLTEWWRRTSWGWLVILGPIIVYTALLLSLDMVGLASDGDPYFRPIDAPTAFREGVELDFISMSGRIEYALVATLYILVAAFSILWSLPKILARFRNPFGGIFGILIAVALTGVLYVLFLNSEYNIRTAFADDILVLAERNGVLGRIDFQVAPLGIPVFQDRMFTSEMLNILHSGTYFIGGAAPWFLVVFVACIASFEPRSLGNESHKSLRSRMALLQIAMVLAAANIVLSIVYLRSMMAWPVSLFVDDLAAQALLPVNRYAALFGALGTLMLISTLAPAYVALNRQFDRVAEHELLATDADGYISYQERQSWRLRHGLVFTSSQAISVGAAVIAPLVTSPTITGADPDNQNRPPTSIERAVDAR